MTRVIHTGDTHVGYRQYHSPERRQDFMDAFEQVIADAVSEEVDAVVHAGDLFHDRRPELPDLLGVLETLRTLDDAGIPFLAVVGNHESTRGGQWLDLFESLGLATRLDDDPVVVGDTAFYGLDHVPASKRDELDYQFAESDASHAALVAHGLFEPFAYADWDTETILDQSNVAFDALLAGDNHTPDTAQVGDTWVTYPGSTERASAGEREARGYNLVTFDDGVDVRRRALDTREFVFLSVELGDGEGIERVRDRIREHDVTDAVVIMEVTGAGDEITPAAVEEFAVERGALIARVRDRREIETETDVSVEFADPDRAVEDRLDEVGFSGVAREIDGLVRDPDVADSNLRERVKSRVQERVEAGTLGEAVASNGGADSSAEGADAANADDDPTVGEEATTDDETGRENDSTSDDESTDDGEAGDGDRQADDTGTSETDDAGVSGTDDAEGSGDETGESSDGDEQITLGDW